jgi:2-oxoglutarate ferredoxin oxidoreductase subunit alpha
MSTVLGHLPAPQLEGPINANVTLVGWGSTWGVITEAVERLNQQGTSTNHLQFKFLMPLHGEVATRVWGRSKRIIIVENNQSGQFARHLRAETGITTFASTTASPLSPITSWRESRRFSLAKKS